MRRCLLLACLMLCTRLAKADVVTIDVSLDTLLLERYELAGQSAFSQTRVGSGTSGSQLDGVKSGGTSISFTELSPPPSLGDYLDFAYFGIIERRNDTNSVIDTSLIIAYTAGSGLGELVSDTFPYTEAELVAALTGGFDSPEFLDMLDLVPANTTTRGAIAVPPIGRPGEVLDLIAFIGGDDGDVGVKVGTLAVQVVPEPSTLGLLVTGFVALFATRCRDVSRRAASWSSRQH